MGKIAVEVERALARRAANGGGAEFGVRLLARGDGWTVEDVICTSGPGDRSYEEQHAGVSVAMVVAGSFQYRTTVGRGMMTPGSLMLGNAGQMYECGHEHAAGDRCVAFRFTPDWFERLADDAGAPHAATAFRVPRVPPVRETSRLIADACSGAVGRADVAWGELAVQVAAWAAHLADGGALDPTPVRREALARVTDAVRAIERAPGGAHSLERLAGAADLSPYHFLRTFVRLTGVTPHQFVLRARLREAATRLALEPAKVIDIALDCGFADVSNFNRAFRLEFGVNPRRYRR